jgi:hypothetical protein
MYTLLDLALGTGQRFPSQPCTFQGSQETQSLLSISRQLLILESSLVDFCLDRRRRVLTGLFISDNGRHAEVAGNLS